MRETRTPPVATSGKIFMPYISTQPKLKGYLMSVQSKFGYCITIQTLNIALEWNGITFWKTDKQT